MRMMSLFKSARKQPLIKMFSRRRSNKGAMWASLIGLAISAVMLKMNNGQKKGSNNNFQNMLKMNNGQKKNSNINFQNMLKNNPFKNGAPMINDTALAEFSEELISKTMQNQSNQQNSQQNSQKNF